MFKTLPLDQLRQRNTMKWTTFDQDVLPLWVAETDFDTCPAVIEAVQNAVDIQQFGYPSDASRLADALTAWCATRYNWDINPAWVHDLPDVLKGVELAINHFTVAGSSIILPTPAYMPFYSVLEITGRKINQVPMIFDNGRYSFDLVAIEEAFVNGAGGLILCNPYNPLGATFTAEELQSLAQLAQKYHARIISDEIHAPLTLDEVHIPTASVSDVAAEVTVTITATSKGWNTPGLKCAQFILHNERDEKTWKKINPFRSHGASTIGIAASIGAYEKGGEWLDAEVEYLRKNRQFLLDNLSEAIPGVSFNAPQATYLAWLNFSEVEGLNGQDPAAFLLEHAKVALNPGLPFGPGGENHARLNFGTSQEILEEFLDRTSTALSSSPNKNEVIYL